VSTIAELSRDYEVAGHFLRRKDASAKKPSPLFSVGEVLEIAKRELANINASEAMHRIADNAKEAE
jgi:hypothetical protein